MSRKRTCTIIRAILFLAFLLFILSYLYRSQKDAKSTLSPIQQTSNPLSPSNSTLGFGAILAVSHTTSPRRPSLFWAANLTGIDIEILEQSQWTLGHVSDFRAKEGSVISTGSAQAWLSHLHALQHFLNTTHETALIIEDDTDFDISIRQSQISLLAAAVRSILSPNPLDDTEYWAPTSSWDILYPGHCDDLISPSTYLTQPHLAYHDASVPATQQMHPDTSLFLSSLNIPSRTRFLHRAYWPFCTFAYAINRRSAALVLETMNREPEGGISAFDVALLTACRDRDWKCWSVAPELFHHAQGESEIGKTDTKVDMGDVRGEGETKRSRRGTWNLRCGARHSQLWVGEDDTEGRSKVKKMVEGMLERGKRECPIDSSEEEGAWKGCEWEECGSQS